MHRIFLAIPLFFGIALPADAAGVTCTIKAAETVQKEQFDELLAACNETLREKPLNSEALYVRGSLLSEIRDEPSALKAVQDLSNSILLAPKFADSYYNRSAVYLTLGEWKKVVADASKAIELDPGSGGAYHNRGLAHMALAAYHEAVEDFTGAIDAGYSQNYGSTYEFRALALEKADRLEEALADYSRAIDDLQGSKYEHILPEAYNGRAWVLHRLGRDSEALPDAELSLRLDGKSAAALDTRAHIYERLGRTAQAIADYRHALEIEPTLEGSKEGLERLVK